MILKVNTRHTCELVDITRKVERVLLESHGNRGAALCLVYCPHTTAGITINENADPDVAADLLAALEHMAARQGVWRHAEGNSPAHVKASLVGCSASVAIADGRLVLGRWQGIFLCEFDGPRTRSVHVNLLGVPERGHLA